MPLMFQENMRKVFALSGGRGASVLAGAVWWEAVTVLEPILHLFAGGGLMSRFMVAGDDTKDGSGVLMFGNVGWSRCSQN